MLHIPETVINTSSHE